MKRLLRRVLASHEGLALRWTPSVIYRSTSVMTRVLRICEPEAINMKKEFL